MSPVLNLVESLDLIEAAAKGNAKLEALRTVDSPRIRTLLKMALSPDITFGVKKLPEPTHYFCPICGDTLPSHTPGCGPATEGDWRWYDRFTVLMDNLASRKVTGGAAQTAIADFLCHCTAAERKWTERILKQDLRMDLGAKDVNKALGKGTIPLFDVPLATDYRKCGPKNFKGLFEIQPKYDGGRAVAFIPGVPGERVRMLSRTGKEWHNFESIRLQLQAFNDTGRLNGQSVYFDGEVVALDDQGMVNFRMIQKTMLRKDGVEVGKLHYYIFDAAATKEWFNPEQTYSTRLSTAKGLAAFLCNRISNKANNIEVIRSEQTFDPTPAWLEEQALNFMNEGLEGAMARRADIPPKLSRSKDLMKVKLFVDTEAKVVGAVEGTGKYVGMLGALACELNGVAFEIGTGFDDLDRAEIWQMYLKKELPELVSLKYQNLSEAKVPRLPVYRSFRAPEDV